MRKKTGFSIVEIIVVVAIIGVLIAIVSASISAVRVRSRNAQVVTDKQNLILALVRAREASPTFSYPGLSGWQCIKSSGPCFNDIYSGNTTIANALTPYLPGGVVPMPPGNPGEYRTGGYLMNPGPTTVGSLTGGFLIWSREGSMSASECDGVIATVMPPVYYCYELLPR